MSEQVLDFTVADLLAGGDDVVLLSTATIGPDGLWDEVIGWSRERLTAALVAAVGIIQADDPPAAADDDYYSDYRYPTGHRTSGHAAGWTPAG